MKWRIPIHDIVLKALGVLLIVAAVLKGHELLTVPVANKDLWSWRPFLIFQVEFELVLGVWLLSGLFKRLAWLAALACFGLFCCVTLYKALTGAASCGCFGTVHVNPWITLLAIDLPAVVALTLFHPAGGIAPLLMTLLRRRQSIHHVAREFLQPIASWPRCATTGILSVAILGLTTPILALYKPATVTSTYEILEPKTWIGKQLPILKYVDIAERLKQGTWLLLFYHHDCPDCQRAILQYEQMAGGLTSKEEALLRVAFVEIPPYGPTRLVPNATYATGRLASHKEWFITTPATVLICEARVRAAWEAQAPGLDTILAEIAQSAQRTAGRPDSCIRIVPVRIPHLAERKERRYPRGVCLKNV